MTNTSDTSFSATLLAPWAEHRQSLESYLEMLAAPDARLQMSAPRLRALSSTLAAAANWARNASARTSLNLSANLSPHANSSVTQSLRQYRALLAELQASLRKFGEDLTQHREQLRSEAGHMRAAEAWVQRSSQVAVRG